MKANNQGELYPLEIGLHALQYVEMASGGRGKKGGLREYARLVGKTHGYTSQIVSAAKVVSQLTSLEDKKALLSKSQHLSYISRTPDTYWQTLTELLIEKDWTVKQTEEISRAVRDIEIPEHFQKWLAGWTQKEIADCEDTTRENIDKILGTFGNLAKITKTHQTAANFADGFESHSNEFKYHK